MRPPSPLSVLTLLAAAALFLASRTSPSPSPGVTTIDDGFLPRLAAQVEHNDTYSDAGEVFYDRFDDLVYLTRRGHPTALAITQRVILHGGTPGGCCCSGGGFRDAVFADGLMPPGYLEALQQFSIDEQVRLLEVAETPMTNTPEGGLWYEDLQQFIAARPALAAAWKARQSELADAGKEEPDPESSGP
jgi:hypothetical protein